MHSFVDIQVCYEATLSYVQLIRLDSLLELQHVSFVWCIPMGFSVISRHFCILMYSYDINICFVCC